MSILRRIACIEDPRPNPRSGRLAIYIYHTNMNTYGQAPMGSYRMVAMRGQVTNNHAY